MKENVSHRWHAPGSVPGINSLIDVIGILIIALVSSSATNFDDAVPKADAPSARPACRSQHEACAVELPAAAGSVVVGIRPLRAGQALRDPWVTTAVYAGPRRVDFNRVE